MNLKKFDTHVSNILHALNPVNYFRDLAEEIHKVVHALDERVEKVEEKVGLTKPEQNETPDGDEPDADAKSPTKEPENPETTS